MLATYGAFTLTQQSKPLDGITSREAYREEREHIFPCDTSLDWFIRKNRRSLDQAKALLVLNRRILIDEQAFDAVVKSVGQSASIAACAS